MEEVLRKARASGSLPEHPILGKAPGKFVELSGGVTHYMFDGPAAGAAAGAAGDADAKAADSDAENKDGGACELVICAHGLGTSLMDYQPLADALVAGGKHRVLRYDYYGRGWSVQKKDADNFGSKDYASQILELMKHLGLEKEQSFTWVGYSTGASVVMDLMKNHAARIKKLVLVAPAVYPVPLPFRAKVGRLPCCCSCLVKSIGKTAYPKYVRDTYFVDTDSEAFDAGVRRVRQLAQKWPVYIDSVVGTMQDLLDLTRLGERKLQWEALGKRDDRPPVHLVWGKQDTTTPFKNSAAMIRAYGGIDSGKITFEEVDKGAHAFVAERPDDVLAAIMKTF